MSEIARPALRYANPNSDGLNFIKFDRAEPNEHGSAVDLIVAASRLPLWTESGRRCAQRMMARIAEALRQNPGYEAVFVFPDLPAVAEALGFIEECGHKGKISAGLHAP